MEFFVDKFEAFIGVNPFTMIFAWINLLILYLFLKKLLFVPVKKMIDSRQAEIDGMYSNAENAQNEAEALKTEYEKKLEAANRESETILKNAIRRAQLREEEILREASAEAEKTVRRAEEAIELEKKQAINEVKDQISGMAVGIAAAIIERDVNAREHANMIDNFINSMEE